MKYSWLNYDTRHIKIVESWLDDEAIRFTGCSDGWNSFYKYWNNQPDMILNKNFWCKVVCKNYNPIAVIALSLYENVIDIMEYVVSPSERNKGYGYDILMELLNNGLSIIGVHIEQANAVIYPNNIASQRIFKKVGFSDYKHEDDAWYYSYRKNNI